MGKHLMRHFFDVDQSKSRRPLVQSIGVLYRQRHDLGVFCAIILLFFESRRQK